MQAVWKLILDDEFIQVYTYGMVLTCIDGIERRIYPRIFTYSADYPEKYVVQHYFIHLSENISEFSLQQSESKASVLAQDALYPVINYVNLEKLATLRHARSVCDLSCTMRS